MATAALALSAVYSGVQQNKARKQQRRANRIAQRSAEIENARSRRANVAAARRARAATIAQGANQGVGGGSSTQGASGSVVSQAAGAVGLSQQLEGLDRQRFNALNSANKAQGNAALASSFSRAVSSFSTPS